MASINQITLPQNFYDVVSTQLLVQPEPQYLHAKWIIGALNAALPIPSDFGLPGRMLDAKGASYMQFDEMRSIISDPIGPNLLAAAVNMVGTPGTTVRLNRPKFTDSVYTEASRRLTPGSSITTTGIAISSEQTMLTLREYSGPHNGSTVAPYAVDKFAAQNGVHNLASAVGQHHSRDFHKFLDTWAVTTIDNAGTALYPKGMTADDDAKAKGMFPFDYETLIRTNRVMDDAKLPRLPDGRRVLVLTPTGASQLGLDKAFQRASQFHPEFNTLFAGTYVGTTKEFHVFYSQTLTTKANTSSVNIHYGQAIAPGALGAAMGMAPEIRPNTNDDFGRTVLTVWLAYLALESMDNRFIYSVRYTEDG